MIRHIQNAVTHHSTARTAARHAKTQTEANPFRSVLDATSATTEAPVAASSSKTAQTGNAASPVTTAGSKPASAATITATITKEASPAAVTLAAPSFEYGATVTNPDGTVAALNWTQFADAATAERVAAKLGGKVADSTIDGYSATQRSIKVPGSQNLVNAGIAAQLFAQYGDKPGSPAWQIINRDLGRDSMAT